MLFNKYDWLREPIEIDPDADYICITDDKELTSEHWKVIYDPFFDTDNLTGIQKTFIFKYHLYRYIPHIEKYDYIVRIDGSIKIHKSLRGIIEYLDRGKYDISVAPHPWRNNFIDEYNTWITDRNLNKEKLNTFLRGIGTYNLTMEGLCENTFQIYKNDKEVFNFLDDVYRIMIDASPTKEISDPNDQCYFTYVLYQYFDKLRINYHPATLYRFSDYMKLYCHNSDVVFNTELLPYDKTIKFLGHTIFVNDLSDYKK
jgi:hypothetical protein